MAKTKEDAAKILLDHGWTLEEINIVLGISDPTKEKITIEPDNALHPIIETYAVSSHKLLINEEDYPETDYNQPILSPGKHPCGFTPLR